MKNRITYEKREKKRRDYVIEDLLYKISQGNTKAIGRLYDLIKTDIYSFALAKMGNKADADDIIHETLLKIYKVAPQYTPSGRPMAWIITIELNIIRRFNQLKTRDLPFDENLGNTPSFDNVESKVTDNMFLNGLMSSLSEEERMIIVLHVISGFRHREIASILNKPLATVLSKYNRALKKLRKLAKEDVE